MVAETELAQAITELQEPQRICDHLIAAANRNGGADNITVVVVEVKGNWWSRLLEGWKRASGSIQSTRRGDDVETYAAV
jgi:serine/threonine protein phosphatase PrpC